MSPLGPAPWGPTLDLTGVGCVNEEGEQMEMLEGEGEGEGEEELQIGTLGVRGIRAPGFIECRVLPCGES